MEIPPGGPGDAAACEWVSARKAVAHFKFRSRVKGLILYTAFFLSYYIHYQLEIDFLFAGGTVKLWRKARNLHPGVRDDKDAWCSRSTRESAHTGLSCWWNFDEAETVEHLTTFLSNGISVTAPNVALACKGCLLGITTEAISLESLSLANFACADFDSSSNSNEYPARDCGEADARWAASPTAAFAPCCRNQTLVIASIKMMARFSSTGQETAALEELTARDSETFRSFVNSQLDRGSALLQVVISRAQRMAGIVYGVKRLPQEWEPDSVWVYKEFWSRRFDIAGLLTGLRVVYLILTYLSLFHTALECWATHVDREDFMHWIAHPYSWVIVATLAFPSIVTSTDPLLRVTRWMQLVAASEIVMLLRLFFEAEIIPACRILLKAMAIASRHLITLFWVLFVVIALLAGISGQLLGVFMVWNYENAFFDVLSQFGLGAVLHPEAAEYNRNGSRLIYCVILLVLFLTLSQVFITILMDSFEAARENREELLLELALPEGYRVVPPPPRARPLMVASGWITSYLPEYGCFDQQVLRGLSVAVKEAETADPSLVGHAVVLRRERLAEALAKARAGPAAERALAAHFGVVREDGGGAQAGAERPPPAHDGRAELRAAVFEQAFAAGVPMAYGELRGLSEEALRRLQGSLAAAAERGAPRPAAPTGAAGGGEDCVDKI